eukprot:scaffold60014_cov67-Phaeocystis_antarctica.AAC.5
MAPPSGARSIANAAGGKPARACGQPARGQLALANCRPMPPSAAGPSSLGEETADDLPAPHRLNMWVDRPDVRAVLPIQKPLAQRAPFRPDVEARRARTRAAAAAARGRRVAREVEQQLEREQCAEEREGLQRRQTGAELREARGDGHGDGVEQRAREVLPRRRARERALLQAEGQRAQQRGPQQREQQQHRTDHQRRGWLRDGRPRVLGELHRVQRVLRRRRRHDGVALALVALGRVRVGVHAPAQRDEGRRRERHDDMQRAQGEAQLPRHAHRAAEQYAHHRRGEL